MTIREVLSGLWRVLLVLIQVKEPEPWEEVRREKEKADKMKRNGFTLIEMLIVIAIVGIIVAAAATGGCGINRSPGEGEKVGQIVRLQRVGMFYKTWEGQLVRGGFQGGDGVLGAAFEFTIEDDALAKRAQVYMRDQTEVRLVYRREGLYSLTRTESSGDFATLIEPVEQP